MGKKMVGWDTGSGPSLIEAHNGIRAHILEALKGEEKFKVDHELISRVNTLSEGRFSLHADAASFLAGKSLNEVRKSVGAGLGKESVPKSLSLESIKDPEERKREELRR